MGRFFENRIGSILVAIVVNGLAIMVASALLPGIHVVTRGGLNAVEVFLILGVVFGLVNAFLKPIISILALPVTILSLGLFQLVINALLLYVVRAIVPNLIIDTFGWAFIAALIIGIVTGVLEAIAHRAFPESRPQPRVRHR